MTLTRITSIFGALALGGVLVASTAGAQARSPATPAHGSHHHGRVAVHGGHFVAPMPHKYGANGMRMGLHCETTDMS